MQIRKDTKIYNKCCIYIGVYLGAKNSLIVFKIFSCVFVRVRGDLKTGKNLNWVLVVKSGNLALDSPIVRLLCVLARWLAIAFTFEFGAQ